MGFTFTPSGDSGQALALSRQMRTCGPSRESGQDATPQIPREPRDDMGAGGGRAVREPPLRGMGEGRKAKKGVNGQVLDSSRLRRTCSAEPRDDMANGGGGRWARRISSAGPPPARPFDPTRRGGSALWGGRARNPPLTGEESRWKGWGLWGMVSVRAGI